MLSFKADKSGFIHGRGPQQVIERAREANQLRDTFQSSPLPLRTRWSSSFWIVWRDQGRCWIGSNWSRTGTSWKAKVNDSACKTFDDGRGARGEFYAPRKHHFCSTFLHLVFLQVRIVLVSLILLLFVYLFYLFSVICSVCTYLHARLHPHVRIADGLNGHTMIVWPVRCMLDLTFWNYTFIYCLCFVFSV